MKGSNFNRPALYSIILISLSVTLLCCKNKTSRQSSAVSDKPATYKIQLDSSATAYDLCDAIDDMSFIELERNDTSFIANVSKVIVVDTVCYVLDKKFTSINMYSTSGKYLGRVGGLGADKDKGEYIEIQDFIYRPKSKKLWVYSNGNSSIIEYALNGNYIRQIRTDLFASSMAATDSLYYYYINNNTSSYSQQYNIVITDTAKKIRDRTFPMSKEVTESIAFSGGIVSGPDYILYNPFLQNTIYKINGMEIEPEYEVDFGKFSLPHQMITSKNIIDSKINAYSYLTPSIALLSNILAFGYHMDNHKSWALFNKKNNHIAQYSPKSAFPGKLAASRFNESNNQIVTSLPNADGLLKLDVAQTEDLEKRFPSYKQSLAQIKDPSNPLLIFIKVKDF